MKIGNFHAANNFGLFMLIRKIIFKGIFFIAFSLFLLEHETETQNTKLQQNELEI